MQWNTPWIGAVGILTAVALNWPQTASAQAVRYRGICDASAAVAIGKDHLVVAEDEHDVLAVYRMGAPSPVSTLELSAYLGNRRTDSNGKVKVKEADIEGAARIGKRIYWIASHGRDSKGNIEATRHRLFATDLIQNSSGPAVKLLSTPPYTRLLQSLEADKRFAMLTEASRLAPEAFGGLNIEGLAAAPEGGLYIGFRNPRPQGKALLLPLRNPAALIDGSAGKPIFDDLITLDLGGRGIRSMERIGNGYAIVAGPFDGGKNDAAQPVFALYVWSGASSAAPTLVPDVDFGALRPEALFEIPGADRLYVLSDDGDERVGNERCKKADVSKRSFRAQTIPRPVSLGRP